MKINFIYNPNLKNQKTKFTKKQVEEFIRCQNNPIYFITEYLKIVTLDHVIHNHLSYITFKKEMVDTFHNNRFTICKLPRQTASQQQS